MGSQASERHTGRVPDLSPEHDGREFAAVVRVTAPADNKKPRPVREHRDGAVWNPTYPLKGRNDSMAVTIQRDGRVRPHLTVAGQDTNAGFEVTAVRAEGLATCINTLITGELADVDEVTAFELLLAAAYNRGLDEGQRALAGAVS